MGVAGRQRLEVSHIANETISPYTKEDFLKSTAPFEAVYELRHDPFIHDRMLERVAGQAAAVGVRNFKKLYKAYTDSLKLKNNEIMVPNVTSFDGQELELDSGRWVADEFGVRTEGLYAADVEACNHPIMPVLRLANIDTGAEKLQIAYRKGKQWRRIIAEKGVLASANKILELANQGVAVTSESAKYLVQYFYDVEALNYDRLPEKSSVSRLGWIDGAGFSPYVEDLVFDGDANFRAFFESVRPKGRLEDWLALAREIRGQSVYARVILAASFASVLVNPLGGLPFFVHLWGGTEAGKTVGLMLAASVWASPEIGRYIHTFNSTAVGREKSAAFVNSLPLILDELQITADKKQFDKDIYMLSEGAGRTRGNKGGGVDRTPTWANCILTSGEMPITGASSGGGAVNRIVEIECREKLFSDPRRVADTVRKHHGHAGHLFVERLQADGALDRAAALYKDFSGRLEATDTTEKQAMAAALILTADALATEWIFTDSRALTVAEIGEFLRTRASVSMHERGYQYLCEAVSQNANKFAAMDAPLTDVWGRMEGPDTVYIIRKMYDTMCADGGFNPQALLSWMAQHGHVIPAPPHLTKTTRVNGIVTRCVCLKLPKDEDFSPCPAEMIPD